MITKKHKSFFYVIICFLLMNCVIFGTNAEDLSEEKQEYKQERARIKALRETFTPGLTNDFEKYEEFADQIQNKWSSKNKEHYARLMLEVCGPLSSGNFKGDRRYELARKYALSALADANNIALETELELTGHVITLMIGPNASKGEDFAQRRKKDVQIRLHAWKRLLDAIDPDWDPNDFPSINVMPPMETGLPAGVSAETIEDPNLRAEYEASIEKNRQKAEIYRQQYKLRKWLKMFPRYAEPYIIQAYSLPPYDTEELQEFLAIYITDPNTTNRILYKVEENLNKQ